MAERLLHGAVPALDQTGAGRPTGDVGEAPAGSGGSGPPMGGCAPEADGSGRGPAPAGSLCCPDVLTMDELLG
ncbi:hypothetical protein ACWEP4_13865 [Streptomyces sp. NPDC004227]